MPQKLTSTLAAHKRRKRFTSLLSAQGLFVRKDGKTTFMRNRRLWRRTRTTLTATLGVLTLGTVGTRFSRKKTLKKIMDAAPVVLSSGAIVAGAGDLFTRRLEAGSLNYLADTRRLPRETFRFLTNASNNTALKTEESFNHTPVLKSAYDKAVRAHQDNRV